MENLPLNEYSVIEAQLNPTSAGEAKVVGGGIVDAGLSLKVEWGKGKGQPCKIPDDS